MKNNLSDHQCLFDFALFMTEYYDCKSSELKKIKMNAYEFRELVLAYMMIYNCERRTYSEGNYEFLNKFGFFDDDDFVWY